MVDTPNKQIPFQRPEWYFVDRNQADHHHPVYDSPPKDYEETFQEVLGGESLQNICNRLRQRHGYVLGADIMGGAGVFRSLPVDGALGITLKDQRTDENLIISDEERNIHVREGNVLRPFTWRRLLRNAVHDASNQNPTITGKVNLMLIRPQGGGAGFGNGAVAGERGVTRGYLHAIASLVIESLEDGGILLAEVPSHNVGQLLELQEKNHWNIKTAKDPTSSIFPIVVKIEKVAPQVV